VGYICPLEYRQAYYLSITEQCWKFQWVCHKRWCSFCLLSGNTVSPLEARPTSGHHFVKKSSYEVFHVSTLFSSCWYWAIPYQMPDVWLQFLTIRSLELALDSSQMREAFRHYGAATSHLCCSWISGPKNALTKTLCVFFCSKPLNLECFFYRAVINETNLQQYKLKEQGGNSL
jgi:hypothetical protein